MFTVLAPAEGLVRTRGRGRLLSILEKETLLTRLRVARDGLFIAESMDWDSYWTPLSDLDHPTVGCALDALQSAWRDYIRAKFDHHLRREFCFRYFSLLNTLLGKGEEAADSPSWAKALQAALGFECFGITPTSDSFQVLAAGTCTLRNPCYLLAKLKMPDALDDPQFLPLITVACSESPELFYHYRQYSLAPQSPMSLLLYPTVSETKRPASFELLDSLVSGVSESIDPRTRQRAQRLCRGVIWPIIQAERAAASGPFVLEFVDVGAGSGSLTASLCRQIQQAGSSEGFSSKIRLWFVDLQPKDATRFFRTKSGRSMVDSVMFLGEDYRDWLSKPQPLPATGDLRLALISKLFNNLSRFSVRPISDDEIPLIFSRNATSPNIREHYASRSLGRDGRGLETLEVSKSRVVLPQGRTFAQLSLSEFFHGLFLLLSPDSRDKGLGDAPFLPIRAFNPECLVTSDGNSVLARLAENCDYILVEDADLTPNDLVDHMRRFALRSITAYNLSKALGLVGNYAYVLWAETKVTPPEFQWERLW